MNSMNAMGETQSPNDPSEHNAKVGEELKGSNVAEVKMPHERREDEGEPSRGTDAWVALGVNRRAQRCLGRELRPSDLARTRVTAKPMRFRKRAWNTLREYVFCRGCRHAVDQYRIPPRTEFLFVPMQFIHSITEGLVVSWTLLHYRTSFVKSFILFIAVYFIFIYIYAFWIRSVTESTYQSTGEMCLPGYDYEDAEKLVRNFNAAFELSWNTFSTVGYGVISVPADVRCSWLRVLLSTEAFIGILYSGFCGAIIMAKITRNFVTAPVTFSGAVCLHYGSELNAKSSGKAGTISSDPLDGISAQQCAEDEEVELSSFPFLEFRVVNRHANRRGAQISYAAIECTVKAIKLMEDFSGISNNGTFDDTDEVAHQDKLRASVFKNGGMPTVKRRYRHATLTHSTNPFFGPGAWYFQHTLDHASPFLRRKVRAQIEKLGGWPTSWNTPTEMRAQLDPHIFEFGLIFTGSSNLTANDVFKAHSFKPEDIYIGWQFVPVSRLDHATKNENEDQSWKVDLTLVHDIVPEDHGRHEPLGSREPENNIVFFLRDQARLSTDD